MTFPRLARRAVAIFTCTASLTLVAPLAANAADGATPDGFEKCYGVAKAGQDDGNTQISVPGMSTVDYQGNAFKYVAKDTCTKIATPFGSGSLDPLDNRPPKPE